MARARVAGLLHDLARLYDAQRLLGECEQRGLTIEPFERRNPIVLHARLGAELARERFGIDDPAVLSAIARHTVAAADMSRLDAIVYLADGLEPERDFPERAALEVARPSRSGRCYAGSAARFHRVRARSRGMEAAPATLAALSRYTSTANR